MSYKVTSDEFGTIASVSEHTPVEILFEDRWKLEPYTFGLSPYLESNSIKGSIEAFILNLLPEGSALDDLCSLSGISRHQPSSLLNYQSADHTGGFQFGGTRLNPFPRKISNRELNNRLSMLQHEPISAWDGRFYLSVSGVQPKLNMIKIGDGWGVGGYKPSTHIIKLEEENTQNLVCNEFFTMRLAKHIGIPVAEVDYEKIGEHPALVVKRFDRPNESSCHYLKRHIIDGCQALDCKPSMKYERNFGSGRDVKHIRDGVSFVKLFRLAKSCRDNHETHLLRWIAFNVIVGNYDAHAKNISYFYDYRGLRLAPFYDLVSLEAFGNKWEREFSMAFGDSFASFPTTYNLADFADRCGVSPSVVKHEFFNVSSRALQQIDTTLHSVHNTKELSGTERLHVRKCAQIAKSRATMLQNTVRDIESFSDLL
ncbi:HipA domain-containing protein [Vibrio vulnificus]|nr:HipA domain-containing protein [Vibrio vulnificus]